MKQYDIFISYRREGGESPAKQLCDKLKEHGYRVFLDLECLKSGPFNKQLYKKIARCTDFLLLLPPHGLDRCINADDWVRLEVEHAKQKGKNIIPIILDGFVFPDVLPESIDFLRYQEGLEPVSRLYDDSVKDLEKRLLRSRPIKKYLRMAVCLFAVLAIIFGKIALQNSILAKPMATPTSHTMAERVPNSQAPEMMSDSLTEELYNEGASVLGGDIPRSSVQSISFRDSLVGAKRQNWDVSAEQNGSVIAWMEDDNLVIAGEGGVRAPKDASFLFAGYIHVSSIDFNGCFSTTETTDMRYMFYGCEQLTALNVSWFDTESVRDMRGMFAKCKSLKELDVSNFQTLNVTDMSFMFGYCRQLTGLDVANLDTRAVTDMSNMFNGCRNLEVLDVNGFDTRAVSDMSHMFKYCEQLKVLDVSGFKTWNVINMEGMFEECGKIEALDVTGFSTENVTNMGWMFSGCKQLLVLDVSEFQTMNVTSFRQMFYECRRLEMIDVSSFSTEQATDMALMFSVCEQLKYLDVSRFKTGNVTTMHAMFDTCRKIETLDVSNFDTRNVTDMGFIFNHCESLKTLNLTGFATQNVSKMNSMFRGCVQIKTLDISMFDTSMAENMSYMFADCSSLEEIIIGDSFTIAYVLHDDIFNNSKANIVKDGQIMTYNMLSDA